MSPFSQHPHTLVPLKSSMRPSKLGEKMHVALPESGFFTLLKSHRALETSSALWSAKVFNKKIDPLCGLSWVSVTTDAKGG